MTRFQTVLATVSLSLATCPAVCRAGFVVDGVLDADYGAVKSTVLFDTTAPIGNFGSPGNTNHLAGYGIYLAADATNVYGFFKADRDIDSLPFSNIYFRTTASGGSNVGFEVTNDRAFTPGVGGVLHARDRSGPRLANVRRQRHGHDPRVLDPVELLHGRPAGHGVHQD